jgi:cellulose biosynthesis protein BcsQ
MRDFTANLLKSITAAPGIPEFDYCIVDCPPAFNTFSFSVIHSANLVLVPINPDVFASRGLGIMLRGLKPRLPQLPRFIVFMNRAKTFRGSLTKESQRFLNEASLVAQGVRGEGSLAVKVLGDFFVRNARRSKTRLPASGFHLISRPISLNCGIGSPQHASGRRSLWTSAN